MKRDVKQKTSQKYRHENRLENTHMMHVKIRSLYDKIIGNKELGGLTGQNLPTRLLSKSGITHIGKKSWKVEEELE